MCNKGETILISPPNMTENHCAKLKLLIPLMKKSKSFPQYK